VDETSWQWRYKNEKRPTYEYRTVTIDEELPELPKDIKSKPSRDEFDRQMKNLTKEADELRTAVEEAKFKRRQVIEGGKVEGSNVTYHDVISENIEEVKKFHAEKRGKFERLEQLKERQNELDRQKQNILK